MSYVGDYRVGKTFHHRFTTVNGNGAPTTLGDSPTLRYYVDGGTTGFTSGLTLTVDFSSVTGQNSVQVIATSSCTGLVTGINVSVMIATGSVSGVSMAGYPVIEYSLGKRSAVMPTTADLTLFVDANGQVGAIVTSINTNVGAVVTAVNTIVPARITAQGIDVGAIVTAINTNVGAIVTAVSTIVPARVTAQGIDVGAIVTAINTIAPARVTAQGIDVGAIVTAFNTIAAARVTAISASGLASLFLTDSGTTYASAVAGSPVKETADNAGGTSLTVTAIASGVWDKDATANQIQGSFGQAIGDPVADSTTLYQAVVTDAAGTNIAADIISIKADATSIRAKVTALTFTQAGNVDANIQYVNDTQVQGTGASGNEWRPV